MIDTKRPPRFSDYMAGGAWNFMNDIQKKGILDVLRENKYKSSEIKLSRRVLSHWRSTGLMDIYGDNPDQTKLSFYGIFWLVIINELRKFGLSLEKIGNIKKQYFKKSFPMLEAYMTLSLIEKSTDVFMYVNSNGVPAVGTRGELEFCEKVGMIEDNYIKLNFNIIKNQFLMKKGDIINQKDFSTFLTDTEVTLIDLIRSGEYTEVILRFSDGIVTHISKKSLEKNPDPMKELKNLINSKDNFAQISIKKINGKIVTMEKVVMEKP